MAVPGPLAAEEVWKSLLEGHGRFAAGEPTRIQGSRARVEETAMAPRPVAAVVACADARVPPEIIFDQPLGSLFVARVPGAVAAESVRWALDIAVGAMGIELLVVVGHTQCLAVRGVIEQGVEGIGGLLRNQIFDAASRARARVAPDRLWDEAARENVRETADRLRRESPIVHSALAAGKLGVALALYGVEDGSLEVL